MLILELICQHGPYLNGYFSSQKYLVFAVLVVVPSYTFALPLDNALFFSISIMILGTCKT